MAEFVEKRLEDQIPEIEEMERTGLITVEERRQLVQKRRYFEYKLGARDCRRADYVSALNFNSLLLQVLDGQRQEMRMFEKREQIEFPIIQRQLMLLKRVTRKYFFDLAMWDMRINFAINVGKLSQARSSFIEMTQKHGSLLSVWVKWAQFELDTQKDFLKAQEILLSRASCYHYKNVILQRELFRCKLLHMEYTFHKKLEDIRSKSSCKEEVTSSLVLDDGEKLVFSGKEAQVIYTKSVASHPEFSIARYFYTIASKFPFAKDIREEIYKDIMQRFGSTPEGLILKAERKALRLPVEEGNEEETMLDCFTPKEEDSVEEHLRSYSIYCQFEKRQNSKLKPLPVTASDRKETVKRYLDLIDIGFAKFGAESPEVLCDFSKLYVEQLLSLLYHCWGCRDSRALIASRLSQRCADTLKVLPPEQLLKWAVLLDHLPQADDSKKWTGDSVVRAAADMHPDHQPLLVYHLQRVVADDTVMNDALLTTYDKMQSRLKEGWLRLAHHTVCTGLRVYSEDDDKQVAAAAIRQRSQFLRRSYYYDSTLAINARLALLRTAYRENGLAGAREIYTEYRDLPPFSEEFQASMVLMELLGDLDKEDERKDEQAEEVAKQTTKFVFDTDGEGGEGHEAGEGVEEIVQGDREEEEEKSGEEEELDEDEESGIDSDEEEEEETVGEMDKSEEKKAMPAITKKPDMARVEAIFELNIRQCGGKHHDMWLVYILVVERFKPGMYVEEIFLRPRAQEKMEGWSVQAYADMMLDIRHKRFMSAEEVVEEEEAAKAAAAKRSGSFQSVEKPAKPELLNSLSSGYFPRPAKKEGSTRLALYKQLNKMLHFLTKPVCPDSERVSWYDVLTTLLGGQRVKAVLHPSLTEDQDSVKKQLEPIKQSELNILFKPGNKFNHKWRKEEESAFKSSDKLQVAEGEERPEAIALLRRQQLHRPAGPRDDIDAMLATSKVLDPNFTKLKTLEPEISKKLAKKLAKKKRAKTAGKGWDYMQAPEMTPELEKSIELLKMRGIMNPKQKFKTSHMKETPKFFQMGTIVGEATDFYNRLTKKQQKSSIAEEIMGDHEAVRYQKRKYSELVARKEATRFRKRRKTTGADYIQVKM